MCSKIYIIGSSSSEIQEASKVRKNICLKLNSSSIKLKDMSVIQRFFFVKNCYSSVTSKGYKINRRFSPARKSATDVCLALR